MLRPGRVVFLVDVDNTLLDNDRVTADFTAWLDQAFGEVERERYWSIYRSLRDQLGYADYLGALQQFRNGSIDQAGLQQAGDFMLEYPFDARLYPDALEAIASLGRLGPVVILSDGDMVFQPRKIRRSGLAAAVAGNVLVYVHKQESLDNLQRRYPADHYVMIDDKPLLLSAMKRVLGSRLTTVFVRQGHYAVEQARERIDPAPDRIVERIGDLQRLELADFTLALAATARTSIPEKT